MSKQLTALEFERMERARLLKEFRAKERALVDLQMQLLESKRIILELNAKNLEIERRNLKEEKERIGIQKKAESEEFEKILEEIRGRLEIKGKFGYHPDTLEIIEDEVAKDDTEAPA